MIISRDLKTALAYYWKRLLPFIIFFIVLQVIVRFAFLIKEASNIDFNVLSILKTLAIGFVYDMAAFVYILLPVGFFINFLPTKGYAKSINNLILAGIFFVFTYILLFQAIAEWFFWDEFSSRFNFIAVDYLVYTTEVIGNIRESYPVGWLLALIALISASITVLFWKASFRIKPALVPSFGQRLSVFGMMIALTFISFFGVNESFSEVTNNRYLNEIAKNGTYELFAAFRNNNLSYEKFYITRDEKTLLPILRQHLKDKNSVWRDQTITRDIKAPGSEHDYNIVLITVESLSAQFMKTFGNKEGLTPYLDDLANKSLFFTNLYATGTRTVYGLSSITLSIPPIPGNSIVRRNGNENLFSLGAVLNSRGYQSKFIYGGYGYFDNMNYFFENNGYQIIDRANFQNSEIHFANVWGICDEDLLDRVLRENDKAYTQKRPFFDMIMTTSNHRPFTYPAGRIDLPSHSGRAGGVKYTDYALHRFLELAKSHPWFDKTIFVIIADHTAGSAGKTELDPDKYHIPLFIYAPKLIKPRHIDGLFSQLDLAPTLLGLLNISYTSKFYGQDMLHPREERAFISNYQKLGYLTKDTLTILKPVKDVSFYAREKQGLKELKSDPGSLDDTLAYYQTAAQWQQLSKWIIQ